MAHSDRSQIIKTGLALLLSALGCAAPVTHQPAKCTKDADCTGGKVCTDGACVMPSTMPGTCSPGAVTCDGAKVVKCSADGTMQTLQSVCSMGCDGGTCVTVSCTPGDQQCDADGKSIDRCNALGNGFSPVSVCALGCDPTTSACKAGMCRPGARQCTADGQIQTCDPTGAMWTTAPCSVGDGGSAVCVSNGLTGSQASAWCEQTSCSPGVERCDGLSIVQCDQTGTGETQVTTCDTACVVGNGSASSPALDGGSMPLDGGEPDAGPLDAGTADLDAGSPGQVQCASAMCHPGDKACSMDGLTLETCNDLGTGYDKKSCSVNGAGVCVSVPGGIGASAARCAQSLCAPGTAWCDGDTVFQCSADGLSETMAQSCLYGCNMGTCADPACVPGQQQCNGDTLEQCSPDQRSFVSSQFCTSGCVTDSPQQAHCAAQVCAPFFSQCSSDNSAVERCRADGTGYDPTPCGQSMTCMDGACVAQQPQCIANTQRCNGGNLQTCTSVDGKPLSYQNVGACLGACVNDSCDTQGSCGPFGLSIALATSGTLLPADGKSEFLVLSDPLVGPDGAPVPDGTLVTVGVGAAGAATPPALLSADSDPQTPGLQVPVVDGRIDFLIQAPNVTVPATITAQIGTRAACSASLPVNFDVTVSDRYIADDFSTTRERDSQSTAVNWNTRKGTITISAFDAGDGRDGPLVVPAGQAVDLSTQMSNGHSYPDMASGRVQGISGAEITLDGAVDAFSDPGTRVLLINEQGPAGALQGVGAYEFGTVQGLDGSNLVLSAPISRVYGTTDNSPASLQGQDVRLIRIPQYSVVQVAGTLTAPAWDGTQGGVLTFFAQASDPPPASCAAAPLMGGNCITGTVTMRGKGYRGASTPPTMGMGSVSTEGGAKSYPMFGGLSGEGIEGAWNTASAVGGVGVSGGGYCCGDGDIVPSSTPANGPSNIAPGTPLPPDNVTNDYFGSGGSYATAGNSTCPMFGPGSVYGDASLGNIFMGGGSGSVSGSTAHSCYTSRSCCRIPDGKYSGACACTDAHCETPPTGPGTFTNACTTTAYCDAISYIWSEAYAGQPGGGIVLVTAGALTLSGNGLIDASGIDAQAGNFGSAGGSIYVRAETLSIGGPNHMTAAGGAGGGDGRIRIDAANIDMGFTPMWTSPGANFVQQAPSLAQSIVLPISIPSGYVNGVATLYPVAVSAGPGAPDPAASYAATDLNFYLSEDAGGSWGLVSPMNQVSFGGMDQPQTGTQAKWRLTPVGAVGASRGLAAKFTLQ